MFTSFVLFLVVATGLSGVNLESRSELSSDSLRAFIPTGKSQQMDHGLVGSTRYVVFSSVQGKNTKVCLRHSDGGDWSPAEQVSPAGQAAFAPSLWIGPDDTIHLVWLAGSGRAYEVYYAKKVPGEETWSTPRSLWKGVDHSNPGISGDSSGGIYIWFSNRESQRAKRKVVLYLSRDSGETWQPVDAFGDSGGGKLDLQVAVGADDTLYACWLDVGVGRKSVLLNVSADSGRSWLEKPVVVNENLNLEMADPLLFLHENGLFVFWKISFASGRTELWADYSPDKAESWLGDQEVYAGERAYSLEAVPYRNGGRVGALWIERVGNDTWQVQETAFWDEDAWIYPSSVQKLLTAAPGYKLGSLDGTLAWEGSVAVVTEVAGPGPGKVWFFYQGQDGNWKMESADKLTGRAETHAAQVFYDRERRRVSLLYYESALPRFFGDPWKPESRLFEILITPIVK